jgi:hypothetical protein
MAKVRLYYDKSGKVLGVEHRPDEHYTDDNVTEGGESVRWLAVDSGDIEGHPMEFLEVKAKKVVKREPPAEAPAARKPVKRHR